MKNNFEYGLTQRPATIGTVPSGFTYKEDSRAKFGVVIYDKRLTKDEVKSFELLDLTDEHFTEMAHKVIGKMGKYTYKYLEPQYEKGFSNLISSSLDGFENRIDMNKIDEFKALIKTLIINNQQSI